MTGPPPGPGAITSGVLIEAAFRIGWEQRDQLLRVGVVPAAISLVLQILQLLAFSDAGTAALLTFAEMVPLSMFSVAGYRLLLLGPAALPGGLRPSFGRREIRYLLLTLGISLLLGLVLGAPLTLLVPFDPGHPAGFAFAVLAVGALGLYGLARLALIFPGCAVDVPISIAESLRRTAGIGGRLWLAQLAIAAASVLAILLGGLLLAASGLEQAAPFASAGLMTALAYAGIAVMLVPPALVFRELSGPPQPPRLSVAS